MAWRLPSGGPVLAKPHITNSLDARWLNKGNRRRLSLQVVVNRRLRFSLRTLAEVAKGPEAEGIELFKLPGFAEHSGGLFRRPGGGKAVRAVGNPVGG